MKCSFFLRQESSAKTHAATQAKKSGRSHHKAKISHVQMARSFLLQEIISARVANVFRQSEQNRMRQMHIRQTIHVSWDFVLSF